MKRKIIERASYYTIEIELSHVLSIIFNVHIHHATIKLQKDVQCSEWALICATFYVVYIFFIQFCLHIVIDLSTEDKLSRLWGGANVA